MDQFYYTNRVARSGSAHERRGFGICASSIDEAAIEPSATSRASYPDSLRSSSVPLELQPIRFAWMKAKETELGQAFHSVYVGNAGDDRAGSFFAHAIINIPVEISARDVIRQWGTAFWQRSCPPDVTTLMPVESWPTEPTWSIEAAREKLTHADFRRIVRDCLCLWLSPPSNVQRKSLKLFINLPADQVAALIRILAECLPRGLLRELTFSTLEDRTDAAARIVGCHNAPAILQGRSVGQSRQVPSEFLFAPQTASAAVGGISEQQFADWAIERISQSDIGSIERLVAAAEKIQAETAADLLEIKSLLLDTATLKPAAVRPFLKTRDRRQLLIDQPDAMHHVLIWSIDQNPEGATLLTELLASGARPSNTTSLYDKLQHLAIESALAGDAERLSRVLGAAALQMVTASEAQKLWDTTFESLEQNRQESARTDTNWALPLSVRVLFLKYYGKNISEDTRREEAWSQTSNLTEFDTLIHNRVHDDVLARSWLSLATQLSGQEEWPPRVLSYIKEHVPLLARTVSSLLAHECSSDNIHEKLKPLWTQFTDWSRLIADLKSEGVPLTRVHFVLNQTIQRFDQMRQSLTMPEVQSAIAQDESLCKQVVAILVEKGHLSPLTDPEYSVFRNDAGQDALALFLKSALLTLMGDGDHNLDTIRSAFQTANRSKLKVGLKWQDVDKGVKFATHNSGILAYVLELAPVNSLDEICLDNVPDSCLRSAFATASKNESQLFLFSQCVRRGLRSLAYPREIQPSVVLEFLDIASGNALDGNQTEQPGGTPHFVKVASGSSPGVPASPGPMPLELEVLTQSLPRVIGSSIVIGDGILKRMAIRPVDGLLECWLEWFFKQSPAPATADIVRLIPHLQSVLEHRGLNQRTAQIFESVFDRFLFADETSKGQLQVVVAKCRELIECRAGTDVERPLNGLLLRFDLMQFMKAPHLNDHVLVSKAAGACKACYERAGRVKYYEAVKPLLIESFVTHSSVRDRDLSSRYRQFATLTDLLFELTPSPSSCYMDFVMSLRSGTSRQLLLQDSRFLSGIAMAAFERSEDRHDQRHQDWERCLKEILRNFGNDVSSRPRPADFAWRVCCAYVAFENEGISEGFERFMMAHFYSHFVKVIE